MRHLRNLALAALLVSLLSAPALAVQPKNIVLIYADDIGYGDFSCYGAKSFSTPNVDRLAKEGLQFTDGHCGSATCTPSRYSLLTGRYAWRKKGTGILPGDASLIIPTDEVTLPSMLRDAGYKTGVVGKWHLGLGKGNVNWNEKIAPGPLECGFDYSFLIPATGDRVPCVYVENHHVVGLDPNDPIEVSYSKPVGDEPTGKEHPELLKMKLSVGHDKTIVNGISRIGYMTGGQSARWVDEDMADDITEKAVAFIDDNANKPFFLYFSTHDIHVPRVPHPRFVGKSGHGPRGDAILQFDWCVGQILEALDRNKLTEDTLVILSSDNGPVLDDGYVDQAVELLGDHKPAGPYRGGKYSEYEGGTRVPTIVRWPSEVKPGQSEALVCQIDFLASLAKLTGQSLPAEAAPDSLDVADALLGKTKIGRDELVEHAFSKLSLRSGDWKYVEAKGKNKAQLYNLSKDIGEEKNLANSSPEKLKEMEIRLQTIRDAGRTRE
ncbi:arylsulfatase [Blastopirellula sp. JC732]|uniref:Arylsulfatase n=1 Tax=Blastopirellula sediminis TaxID=2894196 RepID=A0A9X1SHG4_9BACT|nr:arylsulfatase [Blastopirellula sediminis]MCC9605505.1 arylsulfatase [Blastopirellula sediminis]MCC9631195.1 arylsulfatase [Blastopirellula sediminis]